jgi:hypothetical protein
MVLVMFSHVGALGSPFESGKRPIVQIVAHYALRKG